MSSMHKLALQAKVGTRGEAKPQRGTATPGPNFPRFLVAVSTAQQTGREHHSMPSDDASHSLPLNTPPPTTVIFPTKDFGPRVLFGLFCLGAALSGAVAVSPYIVGSVKTYLSGAGTSQGTQVEGPIPDKDLPKPIVHPIGSTSPKDSKSPVVPDDHSVSPDDDRHLAVDDGAHAVQYRPAAFGLNAGEPTGDPVEVTSAHAPDPLSGPSAALDTVYQVQARTDDKAAASGQSPRPTMIRAIRPSASRHGGADYRVQLAALSAKGAAEQMWQELRAQYGPILGSKSPLIEQRGQLHLLQVGPFDTADEAKTACAELKRGGTDCLLVEPHGS
jgi:cell division septation protein DedD